MPASKKKLKTCSKGHQFYKTSDCPTCPVCEAERKPQTGFLSLTSAPARRALEGAGIRTLQQLAKRSETELLQFHGIGPATIPILQKALQEIGLTLKK